MKYSEKFKDPRWQKKRLEILERDGWSCQICHDSKSTLHVHHRYYLPEKPVWDVPDDALVTMCECCHEDETRQMKECCKFLLETLKGGFFSSEVHSISICFHLLLHNPIMEEEDEGDVVDALEYLFKSKSTMRSLMNSYWNYRLERRKQYELRQGNKNNAKEAAEIRKP